jgi:excisionase family DNA binding protein
MVDRYAPLNERQLAVLRWVADGCPDGAMTGFSYKTTALALQERRLVTVTKKRGVWRAEPTDAGRFYLERGHHPQRPPPRPPGWHRAPRVPGASAVLTAARRVDSAAAKAGRPADPVGQPVVEPPTPADATTVDSTTSVSRPERRRVPVRYRVMVSRVQVAERYVRAVDEQDAARKVQEELARPYSFTGGWRTVDTDLDVVEADSPLEKAPVPLAEDGTLLMPAKRAAAYLGLAYSTFWELVRAGEIDHLTIGRRLFISRDALTAFIEANTRRGTRQPPR